MEQVPDNESMILIATGQLIGEGFDYPRLDTLFLATPVAWKGIVEQYAGRLNRDYDGKDNVLMSQLSLEDICLSFCRDTALEILALRQQGGDFLPCLTTKILRIYSSRFHWYIY